MTTSVLTDFSIDSANRFPFKPIVSTDRQTHKLTDATLGPTYDGGYR